MVAQIAGFLALIAFFPYLYETWKGTTEPKLSTWLGFMAMDALTFVSILNMENPPSILVPAGFLVGAMLVFMLALWKAKDRSFSRLDCACIGIAAIGVVGFVITKDGFIGMLFGLLAMFVSAVPTMVQVYKEPEKESSLAWTLFGLSAVTNLFAAENHESIQTFIYPLVIGSINIPIMVLVIRYRFTRSYQ